MNGELEQTPPIGERVQAIVDAAESAAAEIRHDAEREAESMIATSRAEAERLAAEQRRALEALRDDLRSAFERLSEEGTTLLESIEARVGRITTDPDTEEPPEPARVFAYPGDGGSETVAR